MDVGSWAEPDNIAKSSIAKSSRQGEVVGNNENGILRYNLETRLKRLLALPSPFRLVL
jgi:hypothetical protein